MMNVGYVETRIIASIENDYIKLTISEKSLVDWCIGLSALEKRVIENIKLTNSHGSVIGFLLLSCQQDNSFTDEEFRRIRISLATIEYWLGFLFRYALNGLAEVDHIDIDAGLNGENSQDRSITLVVDKFSPTLSADEMNKLLGM
jgi:hypothetical protein